MHPSRTSTTISLLLFFLGGCEPTCEQVCNTLVECGNPGTERMSPMECEESCTAQSDLYDTWNDQQLRDAFVSEKECIQASSCEDIEAGVCYDDSVWSF